ncbi:MAG: glycosyltransferase family 2 protein [Parcubacteria group bacterium]|nr:glycosyltransferase family 2 protein [Parcubacteria group bacterium]
MNPFFSVIIVSYNTKELTLQAIQSVERERTQVPFEVFVVDNNSHDGSADAIQATFPWITLIRNNGNFGFAKGNNQAIERASGEYIFLLNSDAYLKEGSLRRAYEILSNEHCAVAAAKVLSAKKPAMIDRIGDAYERGGLAYTLGFEEIDEGQYDTSRRVFSASGTAVFYRRDVLAKIGAYDDDFFMYYEDIDLGFRANLAGYQCVTIPEVTVYHWGTASSGGVRFSPLTIRQTTQNMINVIVKDLPTALIVGALPSILINLLLRLPRLAIVSGAFGAYLVGLGRGIRSLPHMLKKRREVMKLKVISNRELTERIIESERQIIKSLERRFIRKPWRKFILGLRKILFQLRFGRV